jgi:hypothetical protein
VFVAEDAGAVAIVEIDLNGVIADLGGGLGANFGFVHGQGGRGDGTRFGAWMFLLDALVVAGGARAFIAEIRKIVMAGVIVGPGDIDARAAGDVDFYAERFFALVNWSRHRFGSGTVGFGISVAAIAGRDGITVRTGFGVT